LFFVAVFVAVDFDVAAKKDIVAKEGITDLFTRFGGQLRSCCTKPALLRQWLRL